MSDHFFSFQDATFGYHLLLFAFVGPKQFFANLPAFVLAATPLTVYASLRFQRLHRASLVLGIAATPCWLGLAAIYVWDAHVRFGYFVAGLGALMCTVGSLLQWHTPAKAAQSPAM